MIISIRDFFYLDKQATFNHVCHHLLVDQKCKSRDPAICRPGCMYRLGDLSCAVGCIIPNEVYNPRMEGKSIDWLSLHSPPVLSLFITKHLHLLYALQEVHDIDAVGVWEASLRKVGEDFDLQWDPRPSGGAGEWVSFSLQQE